MHDMGIDVEDRVVAGPGNRSRAGTVRIGRPVSANPTPRCASPIVSRGDDAVFKRLDRDPNRARPTRKFVPPPKPGVCVSSGTSPSVSPECRRQQPIRGKPSRSAIETTDGLPLALRIRTGSESNGTIVEMQRLKLLAGPIPRSRSFVVFARLPVRASKAIRSVRGLKLHASKKRKNDTHAVRRRSCFGRRREGPLSTSIRRFACCIALLSASVILMPTEAKAGRPPHSGGMSPGNAHTARAGQCSMRARPKATAAGACPTTPTGERPRRRRRRGRIRITTATGRRCRPGKSIIRVRASGPDRSTGTRTGFE